MPQRMNIARGSGEFRVAIVGMGATGVAAFVHLTRALSRRELGGGRRIRNGVAVHCFEEAVHLGRGLAYSTQEDCHRLNMRAGTMSLFPDHPEDFVDWVATDGGGGEDCSSTHHEYVPRRKFGEYLSARLSEAEQQARRCGVEVVHHRAPVHAIDKLGPTYWLTTPKARIECDAALLCVGYLPRRSSESFEQSAEFLPHPFDTARLDQIPPQSRVGILGSSLTAVDAVVTLERRAFRGQVTCFSRRRGLPKVQGAVHGAPKPPALRSCTWSGITRATQRAGGQLSLHDAFQLLRDDLSDVPGAAELPHEARQWECYHVLPTLRRDVAEARAGRVAWYPALDATGAVAPLLWRALTDAAKHEFLRDYQSLWGMVRHCMPLPTAERLLAMVEARTLDVRVGLQSVNTTQARTFELVCSTSRDTTRHAVDYLIDGRGAEFDISRLQSTLLDSLRRGGLLRACAHGGVDVDFDTCALVDAHGQRAPSLFFVGPLTKGVHFYTNSFEIQRDNAQRAVNAMLAGQDQTNMLPHPAPWSRTRSVERGAR